MKLLLIILALILLAALAFADYKWRQWMAARRRDRDTRP
jgi:membrane-anchored protein YejM (alkaline phosphatase superfamily)